MVGVARVTVSVAGAELFAEFSVEVATIFAVPAATVVSTPVVALMDATAELFEAKVHGLPGAVVPLLIRTMQPNWAVCPTCSVAGTPVNVTSETVGTAVTVTVVDPHTVVKPMVDEHAVMVAMPTAVGANVTVSPVPLTLPLVAVHDTAELNAPVP
jgi:hypothetical protein